MRKKGRNLSLQAALIKIVFRYAIAYFASTNPTVEDWRDMFEKFVRFVKLPSDVRTKPVSAGGVRAEWITTPEIADNQVHLHLHGGAYFLGSINTHREFVSRLGRAAKMRSLLIDYRLAPEHPFPAALEDATSAYSWLLTEGYNPNQIIITGDSAGGGLALSTLVTLRDTGVPLPAGTVCISPWTDLTLTGDSFITRAEADPINQNF